MLCKRIIPCLDIKDGQTVKGINFLDLRNAGDPVELAAGYAAQGADELVLLDITATVENRATLVELVRNVARQINIPFTVGGGISSIDHVSKLLYAGADKISINSAAVLRPGLIDELAREFGNQCIVVAIDTRTDSATNTDIVHTHGGRRPTSLLTQGWAKEAESRGAGEILLTSMDADGTKNGFDMGVTAQVAAQLAIPVIASGGAGHQSHFLDLFAQTQAAAGLAASIFHFGQVPIGTLKQYLISQNIAIRPV